MDALSQQLRKSDGQPDEAPVAENPPERRPIASSDWQKTHQFPVRLNVESCICTFDEEDRRCRESRMKLVDV